MKRKLISLCSMSLLIVSLVGIAQKSKGQDIELAEQKEYAGFGYEINTYFKFKMHWLKPMTVCRYDECTETKGNTCTTPGSAFRHCGISDIFK